MDIKLIYDMLLLPLKAFKQMQSFGHLGVIIREIECISDYKPFMEVNLVLIITFPLYIFAILTVQLKFNL